MENSYKIIRNCISKDILNICDNYFQMKFFIRGDFGVSIDSIASSKDVVRPFNISQYADLLTESLLTHVLPFIKDATGISTLEPTYSFVRFYENGQYLIKHTDRPSCQYSITLPLASGCNTPWLIYVDGHAIDLKLGDLLIYKGCEVEHWRDKYEGEWQVQAHLHFVDASDPKYRPFIYDQRERLGVLKN